MSSNSKLQNILLSEEKKETKYCTKNNYSLSLKQRLNEAKALHFDRTNTSFNFTLWLNDREFSITIDALTNRRDFIKMS